MREFELHGGKELARISRELRRTGEGKVLAKQLRKDLRAAAKPLVPKVRASIDKNVPAGGTPKGQPTLRARLKKATTLRVRTSGRDAGISIIVDGRKMPSRQGSLPAYVEGTKPRWRHPVFGDTDRWVSQQPHPFFYSVVRPYGRRARKTVNHTLDEITKKIT